MPVGLVLSESQLAVLEQATKGSNIEFKMSGRTVQLTRENAQPLRDAVHELHMKKFKVKTKTVEHLEICYNAEQIISKIDSMGAEFALYPEANDNTIGLIQTDEEAPEAPTTETAETTETPTEEVVEPTTTGKKGKNAGN